MDFDAANRKRDARLRRRLLSSARHGSQYAPTGYVSGRTCAEAAVAGMPDDQAFADDAHALALLRDLKAAGLLEEKVEGLRVGHRFGLDHLRVRITAAGAALLDEHVPPVPGVADERVVVEGDE